MPLPWDVEDLVDLVAEERGRPIDLLTRAAAGDSITGAVMPLRNRDVIFLRSDLVGLHREHVLCHELGHLLAGHTETLQGLVDDDLLGAATVMLNRRCDYGDQREQEAEAIAELILRRARIMSQHGYVAALG